ncbi:MAG: type I-E CRISPR-associated endoribonuclease Cas2 [Armatimonadetes bacterium]|nr:type I-E CRISPR-associated endoribonuclease Cas2 [Armatimonadota bacterium]NOG92332.1 type I-E CRISPR-associated endoribonuclease Cas2 [Armatimonadota bacterium]
MTVFVCNDVSPRLRGQLSRWLIEVDAGLFVGRVSALVRDLLWKKVVREVREGSATLVYRAPTEQGFEIRTCGDSSRSVVSLDGVLLVRFQTRRESAS